VAGVIAAGLTTTNATLKDGDDSYIILRLSWTAIPNEATTMRKWNRSAILSRHRAAPIVFAAFFACLLLPSFRATAGGWVWHFPPNLVAPESGRRNNVFYVGDAVTFELTGNKRLDRWEVRDYWGEVVDKGPAAEKIAVKATLPGWYKLYVWATKPAPVKPKTEIDALLDDPTAKKPAPESTVKEAAPPPKKTGPPDEELWGDIVGGTTFVILRRDAHFPEMPDKKTPNLDSSGGDELARGVLGMGPQRHAVHTKKIEDSIKAIDGDVALDRKYYLPYDPARKRVLMAAFPNGTGDLDGVRRIVEHFKDDITYWEPRNEPNFGSGGADFVNKELIPFFKTVKGVNPNLKVMGPGTVAVGLPLQPWLNDFFEAGGAKYIDAFSFHIYNGVNGDLWLMRKSMESLDALLKKHGVGDIEKWQTEQGFFACVYGSYQPRLQARWTMLEMMVFEQYGLPREHNHLWYDTSHGFWDFPAWWENDDQGFNPVAVTMRIMAEELHGTNFKTRYSFGPEADRLYVGSLFAGEAKQVAAFMTAGSTDGRVTLKVSSGDKLNCVSSFGIESQVPVRNGVAVVPVCELPVYVELAKGQTVEVVPEAWGKNLVRGPGVKVTSSSKLEHPVDAKIPNSTDKIVNGELENWYWLQNNDAQPWMSNSEKFPVWVEFDLGKPQPVSHVVIFASPCWQWVGSLLDYELQYDDHGKWVTIEHVKEPAKTFKVYSPALRTSVDSFYSERFIFQHEFKPVTTSKVRLVVNETTWGGGATEDVVKAGGQTGPHQVVLREVEVYGPTPAK
jgi:hypothetical protein